jgi:hypothetical protein
MYIYPVGILRLKHGHLLTHHKNGHSNASSPARSDFSQPLSPVDRGSVIALGIILVLTLVAAGGFCYTQIKKKKKKERDTEQQLWRQAGVSTQQGGSIGAGIPHISPEKVFAVKPSTRSRADSGMGSLVVGKTDGWRMSHAADEKVERQRRRTGSQSQALGSAPQQNCTAGVLRAPGNHRRSSDRERSLSPLFQATTSQDRSFEPRVPRRASHHRRQSSVRSIDAFIPARRSSLSQTQYDRRWWGEVASHGGCTAHANRRLSTLAPILEPEAALQAMVFDDVHVCECGRRSSVQRVASGP